MCPETEAESMAEYCPYITEKLKRDAEFMARYCDIQILRGDS